VVEGVSQVTMLSRDQYLTEAAVEV
jgi:hypothetical protein